MTSSGARRRSDVMQGSNPGVPLHHAWIWCPISFLLLLGALGCAHTPPTPLSEEVKAQLGRMALAAARYAPEIEYGIPGQGGAGGAVIGAAKGLGLGTLTAAVCFVTIGHVPEACVLALGTPYFVVRYAVDQARQGVPHEEIAPGEAAVKGTFAARDYHEALRDQVPPLVLARTGQLVSPLPDLGPATPAENCSYRNLAPHGIDTVLEITVQRVALQPNGIRSSASASIWSIGADELNPVLHLVATTRTRVIKTVDESVLFNATRQHDGRGATFTEWSVNDAQLLRDELEQFLPRLASEIVAQVFGEPLPPESEPASPIDLEKGKDRQSEQEPISSEAESSAE